jgi:hypothetical protein
MTETKWEPNAICKNCGEIRKEHSGDDSMDCLVRFEPVECQHDFHLSTLVCLKCGHRYAGAEPEPLTETASENTHKGSALSECSRLASRVEELEKGIRNFGYWLDEDQVSMWCKVCDAAKGTQHARIYGVDTKDWGPCPVGQAENGAGAHAEEESK